MNRRLYLLTGLALAVGGLAVWVFWPCVFNALLMWDDNVYVGFAERCQRLTPSSIRWAFTSPAAIFAYYHPLTTVSHVLDYQVWGRDAVGYHATSLILHGLNAGLVFLTVWMLTGCGLRLSPNERGAVAVVVGIVFAIHPLQTQAVAWLAERKTVLGAFFSLSCLCTYFRVVAEPVGSKRKRAWGVAMTIFFAAALLAKPMAVALPVVMLIMDYYPMRRHQAVSWVGLLKEKAALFALSAASALATIFLTYRTEAVSTWEQMDVVQRGLLAARGIIFYLWKLAWPAWLSPYYPVDGTVSWQHVEFAGCVLLAAIITGVVIRVGSKKPALLATWLAYVVMILPMSGLVQGGHEAAADRHMYLAMLPVLVFVGGLGVHVWRQFHRPLIGLVVLVFIVCYLAFLGFRTRAEIAVWRTDETLWRAAFSYFPNSIAPNSNLAVALVREGRFDEAAPYATTAVRLNPRNDTSRVTQGLIDMHAGRYRQATTGFQAAIALKPKLAVAHYNLACAYSRLNQLDQSQRSLETALSIDPHLARLVEGDEELVNLRNDPEYGPRVRALTGRTQPQ